MDTVVTILLQGAFYAVFAAVVARFLRRRSRLNRDVVLAFGSVAGLFLLTIASNLVPGPDALQTVSSILLVAQPFLTVRLVGHFGRVARPIALLALAGFAIAAVLVTIGITGNRPALLYVVGYFVVTNTYSAIHFGFAARTRVGTARTRLAVAGLATFLFGVAILVAGAGAATASTGQTAAVVSQAARMIALLAGVGYLLAFAPPRWVRTIQQQAIAFELNRDLLAVPSGTDPSVLWSKLAAAGRRVTGAGAAVIVGAGPDGTVLGLDGAWPTPPGAGDHLGRVALETSGGAHVYAEPPESLAGLARDVRADTTIVVPIGGSAGTRAQLVLFVTGSLLFVDDDLALLSVLASRTLTAIEREEALADRSALVATLRRTNDELARASAAKTDFLAAMSHELRTPLNSIIGFSELLMAPIHGQDGRRTLDVVDQAGYIHGAGLQLLDLINEVLDLTRIEAGRLDLHYERFDLGRLARATAESMAPLADRRGLKIEVSGPAELEIEADPGRLRQIVFNLLSNAIKFSPDGGIIAVRYGSGGDDASIAVQDEGPGIPAAEQALVFEAFAQGASGRRHPEGAGLGLALSRQLAEAHGGRIDLVSEPGSGATFTALLPIRRPAAAAARGTDGRRLVLVIEDDPGSVALLRSWLEPEGYSVTSAGTGEEGLELARTLAPDAVVLDILLPGLDGWDVLQQLRIDRRTRAIPILIVSVVDDEQLGIALGAADYFVKPVERDHLLGRLRDVTAVRRSGEPLVVLAVDPDEESQRGYRAVLEGAGQLVEARNGAQGRDRAIAATPDVILLDLGLSDMSPFDLLAEFRSHPATRTTPVFAVSAHPLTDDDKARLTGQVVAVLEKRDVAGGLAGWLAGLPRAAGDGGDGGDGAGDGTADGADGTGNGDAASDAGASPGDGRESRVPAG